MVHESPLERVLAITRDILRVQDLDTALESIARAVRDLYEFRYVTIVAADASGGDMRRRVMLGWGEDLTAERQNERVVRSQILEVLRPGFEVVENGYFIPAEREFEWEQSIYAGEMPLDSPRLAPDQWHERDALAFVLRDRHGEMLAYISVDGPLSGKVPSKEQLNSMQLFVNLTGLALANAQATVAEFERGQLLEASQTQLRHEATHDALTGLPNRAYFAERLAESYEISRISTELTSAVLFIDLDEFKSINDSLGHLAGDGMLVQIAERMRQAIAPSDFVARIGGDEFAIIVSERRSAAEIEDYVARVQEALARPMEIEGRIVFNTASIGIAIMHDSYANIDDVLRNADTAMYHAKALGRARHAFFDEHMHLEATRRLTLTNDLRMAIEREQFTVVFQPIVAIENGLITGFEALVRWLNPATGEVLPGEFVPLAEDVGLIVAIGRFVFVESCHHLARWRAKYPDRDLRMHVNLSVQEVLQPDIDAFVARTLRRFGLAAGDLTLELTETSIMRSGSAASVALERLQATGARICIDDFGTGYSSLRYLHQFPIDSLKIDRSFVESADGMLGSPPIVRMMIQLAGLYDIEVVAEGVETLVQARSLLELECIYAQGYHFHRPMSPEAIDALLDATAAILA